MEYKARQTNEHRQIKKSKPRLFKRYSWSFDRMHPIAQTIYVVIIAFIFIKLFVDFSWAMDSILRSI